MGGVDAHHAYCTILERHRGKRLPDALLLPTLPELLAAGIRRRIRLDRLVVPREASVTLRRLRRPLERVLEQLDRVRPPAVDLRALDQVRPAVDVIGPAAAVLVDGLEDDAAPAERADEHDRRPGAGGVSAGLVGLDRIRDRVARMAAAAGPCGHDGSPSLRWARGDYAPSRHRPAHRQPQPGHALRHRMVGEGVREEHVVVLVFVSRGRRVNNLLLQEPEPERRVDFPPVGVDGRLGIAPRAVRDDEPAASLDVSLQGGRRLRRRIRAAVLVVDYQPHAVELLQALQRVALLPPLVPAEVDAALLHLLDDRTRLERGIRNVLLRPVAAAQRHGDADFGGDGAERRRRQYDQHRGN